MTATFILFYSKIIILINYFNPLLAAINFGTQTCAYLRSMNGKTTLAIESVKLKEFIIIQSNICSTDCITLNRLVFALNYKEAS